MSVQFGRWNFAGETPALEYVEKVSASIAPYGPDSSGSYSRSGICILYRGFHTTKESRREKQPHICPSGAVLTWDGRLDNREDLIGELPEVVTLEDGDAAIVASAWERWGTDCFAKLIGDWALAIWNPRLRSLILAKDPIGPRHLYYSFDDKRITWCTVLDPLVLFADKTFKLCEEYIAGWLSLYPATHLTPYVGIQSVPPASCVFLGQRKHIVAKYWDFDPGKKVRYRSDAEYEEHFRAVFSEAVQRRISSDTPILAELSGGVDSSSIVCVADDLIHRGTGQTSRLDTISYYNDSEPNWNERRYFAKVEQRRGRIGYHIDVGTDGSQSKTNFEIGNESFLAVPGCAQSAARVAMSSQARGNRVLLSGIGGDEVMGGVPTPLPELEDLFVQGRFCALAGQLKKWALLKRKPWFHLCLETARTFFPVTAARLPSQRHPPRWYSLHFTKSHWTALTGYRRRVRLFGSGLPSFQESVNAINGLRRQLGCKRLSFEPTYETRYPYLDRSLLEFMLALPPEQLVRPGQRRSLMRRALVGIVPAEILHRKQKAFVCRAPLVSIAEQWTGLTGMAQDMVSSSIGIVDQRLLFEDLEKARQGEQVPVVSLIRTIQIEYWLRNLVVWGILSRTRCAECLPQLNTNREIEEVFRSLRG